jgi:hypothetical protein
MYVVHRVTVAAAAPGHLCRDAERSVDKIAVCRSAIKKRRRVEPTIYNIARTKMFSVLGGDIRPGDFVFAGRDNGTTAVCQIHSFVNQQNINVVWWVESDAPPPLCPILFQNVLRSQFIKLFPDSESVIISDDVVDIAFVFGAEILENKWTDLAGMSRVFFYKISQPQTVQLPSCRKLSLPDMVFFTKFERKGKQDDV